MHDERTTIVVPDEETFEDDDLDYYRRAKECRMCGRTTSDLNDDAVCPTCVEEADDGA